MKYGVYGLLWTGTLSRETMYVFDKCKAFGFDGVEIPLLRPLLPDMPLDDIRKVTRELGLECVFSTGLDKETNIVSADPSARHNGVKYLKECIEIVASFGSDILGGVLHSAWAVFSGSRRTEDEWKWARECLFEAAEFGKENGVVLAIEPVNRYEAYFLNTAEDGKRLIKDVGHPNLKLHLDTFQMNIEEPSLADAIRLAASDLYHFHCCENYRGIPGKGHIPWDQVFDALVGIGYERWLVIESFTPDNPDIVKNVCIWRDLAPSSDAIAGEGLRNLKAFEAKSRRAGR